MGTTRLTKELMDGGNNLNILYASVTPQVFITN
jgi:hypothetical protein